MYEKNTIYIIKDAFNQHYTDNQIKSNNPKIIWNELHKKLDQCDREDCWLDLIEDEYLREDMKNNCLHLFNRKNGKPIRPLG